MKTLSTSMLNHLASGATSICRCWRIVRTDSVVLGFTDHDVDLVFDGTTFQAASGFIASQITESVGLNVDTSEVDGALDSSFITEQDIISGKYDDSSIELFLVNWRNVSDRILQQKGIIGEIKQSGNLHFSAELRSITTKLNEKSGRTYQRYCDAVLGDSRCGKSLAGSTFTGSLTVSALKSAKQFVVTGLSSYDDDWFSQGVMTQLTGTGAGFKYQVRKSTKYTSSVEILLWADPLIPIAIGDTFTITAGCRHDIKTCRDKFNNVLNFQGFPWMPGTDAISQFPKQGDANNTGLSRVDPYAIT